MESVGATQRTARLDQKAGRFDDEDRGRESVCVFVFREKEKENKNRGLWLQNWGFGFPTHTLRRFFELHVPHPNRFLIHPPMCCPRPLT